MIIIAAAAALVMRGAFAANVHAADTLTIKAGFYGGPYHTVKTFSYDDMCSLAMPDVLTYSGMDTGNFVRVCYAWGVKLEDLLDSSNIDRDSVKYFHMSTEDDYGESTTTFSDGILAERYFYPALAEKMPAGGQLSSLEKSYSSGAQSIPAIIAINCTDFSREEALRVQKEGSYRTYTKDSLPSKYRYRLIYGQKSLSGDMSLGYNVQTSGKYIYAIEVQLEGSPGISIDKTLVAGTKNKVGSKYELAADVTLPSSYSYLDSDTLADLKQQVASGIRVSGYDTDVVRVTGLTKSGTLGDDGRCEVETIGRGKTRMTFSYSRKEAFGETTSASSSVGLTGGNGKSSGTGGSGSSKKDSQKSSSGGTLRQASDELSAKVDKASGSGKSGKDWISFDGQNSTVDINAQDSSDLLKTTGVTALLLLAAGAAGETLNFRRAVSRKKKKKDSTEGE
ncbi:MAG: hypothetical protein LKJ83_06730 [Eubacteriaceae bacterium]|nr:hypothetical protein [Eubacteriaceae bacterium]